MAKVMLTVSSGHSLMDGGIDRGEDPRIDGLQEIWMDRWIEGRGDGLRDGWIREFSITLAQAYT